MKSKSPSSLFLASAATATAFVAIAQQVMGRATRDALFLSSFPVERLPVMMIAGAAASLLAAVYIGRLITSLSPARVIPWLFGTSGVLLAVEWATATAAPRPLAVIIYLHWAVFGGTLVSTFWSVVNEGFDPRAAKRYVGWIASGGTLGGIVGGVAAFSAARTIGLQDTLLVLSALHLLAAVLSLGLAPRRTTKPHKSGTTAPTVPSALGVILKVGYLRNLGALVATVSAMEALADYTLNARAAAKWAQGSELMSFFSLFHMMVSIVTFLFQVLAGRLALERLGIVGAMAMLPLFAMGGAATAALAPSLWSAVGLRGAMAAIGNSLYRSGYELLFGPLPLEKKRPTKTIIDVSFDRIGTSLGSGFALSMIALLPSLVPGILLVAVLGLGVLCLVLARRLQLGYVRLLEQNLTVAPALQGRPRPELGLSQTFGRMDRGALMKEIAALRSDNLLVSGEMTSPFAWFDVPETGSSSPSSPGAAPISGGLDSRLPRDSSTFPSSAGEPSAGQSSTGRTSSQSWSSPPEVRTGPGVRENDMAPAATSRPSLSSSADYLATQTAMLLSGDLPRQRTALEEPSFDPRLAAHAIVLLANDKIQKEAVRALRTVAHRITGQLIDALLDRTAPSTVRRRVARVMSACTSQRAVEGLVDGLLDDSFEVRYQCGLTLLKITENARKLTVSKEGALAAVRREVDLDRKLWQHQPPLGVLEEGDVPLVDDFLRDRTSRSLQHVFSILALVFEREPMRLALTALSGNDENLRGTALEYLDEVLPGDVKAALWPFVTPPPAKERTRAGGGAD